MENLFFIFWAVSIFLFGAAIGSFLNVVIHRTPIHESIVTPGSHCPKCDAKIRFYDNAPILSYLILMGRCRYCRSPISIRYPIVELITALIGVGLYWRWGLTPTFGVFFLFSAAMIAVFFIDLDHLIIPDAISLNGIPIGLAASIVGFIPWMDWRLSLIGFFVGGAILYVPALIYEEIRGVEGLGAGDVKLLAMMGSFIGPMGVFFVLFCSSFTGSIVGLVGILFARRGAASPIPFGPFLAAAGVVYVFLGGRFVDDFLVRSIRTILGS
jgi:leader peptidase (prepilin peptidase)/N-methyltransferase